MIKKNAAVKRKAIKLAAKRKVVTVKPRSTNQLSKPFNRATVQKLIASLQKKLHERDAEAVHELKLKLSDARKVVTTLEHELEALTGKAQGLPRVRRERRPSITDESLPGQILKVMSQFGKEGMNAKGLADKLNQDAIRVRKYIKDNPKTLKRQGSGPGTRFFLP